eukprot:49558-Pyramimonas_sp.AAC.2
MMLRGSYGVQRGSKGGPKGVQRGSKGRPEGVSSRCVVQYRGAQTSKTPVTNVVNTQDSQEKAPRATYWFLGIIQDPHEAPVYIVGLPKDR